MGNNISNWQFYGTNAYEAAVNGVVGDLLLIARTKKVPGLELMLKHGLEKALTNIVGSAIAYNFPVSAIAPLDMEYLSTSLIAALSQMWHPGTSMTFLAGEQALISILSHTLTTGSVAASSNLLGGRASSINVNSAANY